MSEEENSPAPIVLIAEDEEPIAQALGYIVEEFGCMPIIAYHGKQALELAIAYHPALIITDLMMPQMSGAQLVAAVRADAAAFGYRAPPIVLMSAAGKQYVVGAGADAILPKPFDVEDIEAIINRFLPHHNTHP